MLDQSQDDPTAKSLLNLLTSFFIMKSIAVVAELRIADILRDEPKGIDELAKAASVDSRALFRILRALMSVGIFAQDEDDKFTLNPMADLLRSDVQGSLRAVATFMGHPCTWSAWGQLAHSVRTSKPAFDHVFGMSLFDYMRSSEEFCTIFNDAMRGLATHSYPPVVKSYDFSDITTIVDVGGGTGALLASILQINPHISGMLFDLPHVIEEADAVLETYDIAQRCRKVGGDFFKSIPEGGDAYLLATVIHDWDDERSLIILKNCRRVVREGGRLLLIETLIPEGGESNYSNILDIEMLVLTPGGRERTLSEYRTLLQESGFELTRVIKTQSPLCLIEGTPA